MSAPVPGSSSPSIQLIVFADDWGRHPSSCQHLIKRLLPRYPTLWVNTIGTRPVKLSAEDLKRVAGKLREWSRPPKGKAALPANLRVIAPKMWPGFRGATQRRLNRTLLQRAIHRALGPRRGEKRVVITTLPITADLVGALDADAWIYYCVDDFSVWPGLDGPVMQTMEDELVGKADRVVAVSETLRRKIEGSRGQGAKGPSAKSSLPSAPRPLGPSTPVSLITHGIDMEHWSSSEPSQPAQPSPTHAKPSRDSLDTLPDWAAGLARPIFLFWGLIDARLDVAWCQALADGPGTLVLVGPTQGPEIAASLGKFAELPGALPYEQLPAVARWADVLVMPYADLPVTRAIQPLKFKEYLATGKPCVVRDLPATREWSDAADVVGEARRFVEIVRRRATEGATEEQMQARTRLVAESWENKARQLEDVIQGSLLGQAIS